MESLVCDKAQLKKIKIASSDNAAVKRKQVIAHPSLLIGQSIVMRHGRTNALWRLKRDGMDFHSSLTQRERTFGDLRASLFNSKGNSWFSDNNELISMKTICARSRLNWPITKSEHANSKFLRSFVLL